MCGMSKGIKHQPHSSKNEGYVSVVVEMMHYWPQRPLFEAAVLRLEMMEKHTKQLLLCKMMMLQDYYYYKKFSTSYSITLEFCCIVARIHPGISVCQQYFLVV
jgi:hypothetical protein